MNDSWSRGAGWHEDTAYGEVFFKRAVGELPEMESSKAAARRVCELIRPDDHLLDAGCGAGHYLRSLRRIVPVPFSYTGTDVAPHYIDLGRRAFAHDDTAAFEVANIDALQFPDRSFDIVMCNNVLLHLRSIGKPLAELCRVARRRVLVRTLIGDRSFLIREVRGDGDGLDEEGEPLEYNWYNIWSKAHVANVLSRLPRVHRFQIDSDRDFDGERIEEAAADHPQAANVTRIFGEWQINGYILQPWCFLSIELEP